MKCFPIRILSVDFLDDLLRVFLVKHIRKRHIFVINFVEGQGSHRALYLNINIIQYDGNQFLYILPVLL